MTSPFHKEFNCDDESHNNMLEKIEQVSSDVSFYEAQFASIASHINLFINQVATSNNFASFYFDYLILQTHYYQVTEILIEKMADLEEMVEEAMDTVIDDYNINTFCHDTMHNIIQHRDQIDKVDIALAKYELVLNNVIVIQNSVALVA